MHTAPGDTGAATAEDHVGILVSSHAGLAAPASSSAWIAALVRIR